MAKSVHGTSSEGDIEQLLFAKREKIYPREVHGIFAALRVTAVIGLLGLYYVVCWLDWDGRQAVLFDLPARKFYVFGLTFWPQDFVYLTFLLIIAALSLFFLRPLRGDSGVVMPVHKQCGQKLSCGLKE